MHAFDITDKYPTSRGLPESQGVGAWLKLLPVATAWGGGGTYRIFFFLVKLSARETMKCAKVLFRVCVSTKVSKALAATCRETSLCINVHTGLL